MIVCTEQVGEGVNDFPGLNSFGHPDGTGEGILLPHALAQISYRYPTP